MLHRELVDAGLRALLPDVGARAAAAGAAAGVPGLPAPARRRGRRSRSTTRRARRSSGTGWSCRTTPWGEPAFVLVGALSHSGRFRGVFCEQMTFGHLAGAMHEVLVALGGTPQGVAHRPDGDDRDRPAPTASRVDAAQLAKHYGVERRGLPAAARAAQGRRRGRDQVPDARSWWRTARGREHRRGAARPRRWCVARRRPRTRPGGDGRRARRRASRCGRCRRSPTRRRSSSSARRRGRRWSRSRPTTTASPPAHAGRTVTVLARVGEPLLRIVSARRRDRRRAPPRPRRRRPDDPHRRARRAARAARCWPRSRPSTPAGASPTGRPATGAGRARAAARHRPASAASVISLDDYASSPRPRRRDDRAPLRSARRRSWPASASSASTAAAAADHADADRRGPITDPDGTDTTGPTSSARCAQRSPPARRPTARARRPRHDPGGGPMSTDTLYQQLRGHLAYLRLPAVADRLAPALEAAERDKPGYTRVPARPARRRGRRRRATPPAGPPALRQAARPQDARAVRLRRPTLAGPPPRRGPRDAALHRGEGQRAADRAARRRQDDARHDPRPPRRRGRLPRLLHHRRRPRRPHRARRDRRPLGDHDALLERPAAAASSTSSATCRCPAKPPRTSSRSSAAATNTARIVLTTNRGIADWGHIFEDTTVAAAILDRLLHHATVLSITGDSYRMRRHRDAINALRPALTGRPQGGEFSSSHLGNSRDP